MNEFNLSKNRESCGYICDCGTYSEKDVKEFIRLLKEKTDSDKTNILYLRKSAIWNIIDKLAGDKLVESKQ